MCPRNNGSSSDLIESSRSKIQINERISGKRGWVKVQQFVGPILRRRHTPAEEE